MRYAQLYFQCVYIEGWTCLKERKSKLRFINRFPLQQEQPLLTGHCRDIWLTQKTATQLIVEHSSNRSTILHGDIPAITGVSVNERYLVITNSRIIVIYKIGRPDEQQDTKTKVLPITQVHTFTDPDCVQLFIWDEAIIVLCRENIKFYSFGGVILREIFFNDTEGMSVT